MDSYYFKALTITSVATLFFMLPRTAEMAVGYTVLTALLPLLPMPTVCIILWTLLPFFSFSGRSWQRFSLLLLPVITILLGLYLPPILAEQQAQHVLKNRQILEPVALNIPKPIGIEIRRLAGSVLDGNGEFYNSAPCFELCERLLTGGDVAWMRIIIKNDRQGQSWEHDVETRTLAISASPEQCHAINPDFAPDRRCVYYAPDDGRRAEMSIAFDEEEYDWHRNSSNLFELSGERIATAYLGPGTSGKPLFQLKQIFYQRPIAFIRFNFGQSLFNGDNSGGFVLERKESATPGIDLVQAVQSMGFKLGLVRTPLPKRKEDANSSDYGQNPPDPQDTIYAKSILYLIPGPNRLQTMAYYNVAINWIAKLRWEDTFTDTQRDVFCAINSGKYFQNWMDNRELIRTKGVKCHSRGS